MKQKKNNNKTNGISKFTRCALHTMTYRRAKHSPFKICQYAWLRPFIFNVSSFLLTTVKTSYFYTTSSKMWKKYIEWVFDYNADSPTTWKIMWGNLWFIIKSANKILLSPILKLKKNILPTLWLFLYQINLSFRKYFEYDNY